MTEKSTAFSESSIRSAGESLEQYHIEVYPTLESTNPITATFIPPLTNI